MTKLWGKSFPSCPMFLSWSTAGQDFHWKIMARGRGVDNYFSTFHLAAKYMFTHLHITRAFFTTHPTIPPSNTIPAGACNHCCQPILRHSPSSSFLAPKISALKWPVLSLSFNSSLYFWGGSYPTILSSWDGIQLAAVVSHSCSFQSQVQLKLHA